MVPNQESISPTLCSKVQLHMWAFFGAIQFHKQNYAQLCQYTQLEFMLKFYTVDLHCKPVRLS